MDDAHDPSSNDDVESLPARPEHTVRLVRSRDRGRALLPAIELEVSTGPDAGKRVVAGAGRLVVGTDEKADLVLSDRTVSRFHCEVALDGERVAIRDLGSRNGTFVDGVSVVHAYLARGCKVTLGQSELVFGVAAEPATVELAPEGRFGSLIGESTIMRAAFAVLARAAASDATVLLSGETGCGKELAAESLHAASARHAGPFVVVDCGAIPPELLESELFGHEKGAFTGAVNARAGAFEAADGGTIFLDEVGELRLDLQPKLLRALESRQLKRVGSNAHRPVDVRVVAATHRDLKTEVNAGRFRSDLYYRLAVVEVRLPPLRERKEDLPILVEHLLSSLGAARRPEANVLRTEQSRTALSRHDWPGNVRELRNHVERCLALGDWQTLGASTGASGEAKASPVELREAREQHLREFEHRYLVELLQQNDGNVSAAARAAGIDRKYLYRLLWRHGLR